MKVVLPTWSFDNKINLTNSINNNITNNNIRLSSPLLVESVISKNELQGSVDVEKIKEEEEVNDDYDNDNDGVEEEEEEENYIQINIQSKVTPPKFNEDKSNFHLNNNNTINNNNNNNNENMIQMKPNSISNQNQIQFPIEEENKEVSDHEYDVEDSDDSVSNQGEIGYWRDIPRKKRQRWEGGGRQRNNNNLNQSVQQQDNRDGTFSGTNDKLSLNQSQSSQFFLHSSLMRSSIGSAGGTTPNRSSRNRSNKISSSSPIGPESQMVVYNADTLPDSAWG